MFEIHLLIPLADNDHRTFSETHHVQFEQAILARFGGFSRMPGTIAGQWIDQSTIHHDTLRGYTIAMRSITEGGKVAELVDIAKTHYRQEAIYVRYLGLAEIL